MVSVELFVCVCVTILYMFRNYAYFVYYFFIYSSSTESSANWGPWSPWIQSGDKDFRFRSCNVTVAIGKNATNITCAGERIQFSSCPVSEKKSCHSANGEEKTSFVYECNGHDPMDIDIKCKYQMICMYSFLFANRRPETESQYFRFLLNVCVRM